MSEARPARETGPARDPSESAWNPSEIFRSVLESVTDGVIVVDDQGKFLMFNPAATRILRTGAAGVPPWRWTDAYGLYLSDTVTPYPPAELPLARALRGETVDSAEVFVRHAGAPEGIWTSCCATPLRDAGGAIRGAVLILRDVTRAHRTAETLRKERDWAAAVMDTAGTLILVLDRQGRVVSFNRACELTTGYSVHDVVGKPFWDLFLPPDQRELVRAAYERIRAADFPKQHEDHWLARDGSRRLIVWSNSALLDAEGQVEYVIATGIDITDRKHAEERLRQVNETLRTLIEASPLPIWAHDLEGRVMFWNPAAERVFGWSEQEVLGKPLPIIPDEQQDDFQSLLDRYCRGETLRGLERRRRR